MESYKIKNLTFAYPDSENYALCDINLTVGKGEIITLCGRSGCGKTTLLRLLKTCLAPAGNMGGEIYFEGKPLTEVDLKTQASQIGFVLQSPDNQIVTDKVWHELAFGLESMGVKQSEMRTRVAEMASFFGIQNWFHKNVKDLSGGQKQLLNLASVMVMQPSVIILDEPTSQLDPIAAQEFLKTLEKINRELGTTIILTEHRLEEVFPVSDHVVVIDNGRIIADAKPQKVGEVLKSINHPMCAALPAAMRVYGGLGEKGVSPVTVREGRRWLEEYAKTHTIHSAPEVVKHETDTYIELKDLWFRYKKDSPDVVKGLDLTIGKGEIFGIVGGNGTGKTTLLSLISGLNVPYRGKITIDGKSLDKTENLYGGVLGMLPQNPQTLFVKKTVYLDLLDVVDAKDDDGKNRLNAVAELCRIGGLMQRHPYDLSGGEQQRVALAKLLLKAPNILLMDEPTKGMDAEFKQVFATILQGLKSNGVTVIMVSHDIEFCAAHTDRCAMLFDGVFVSEGNSKEFFAGKSFYTTSASRMARTVLPGAVLVEDIITSCGGIVKKEEEPQPLKYEPVREEKTVEDKKEDKKTSPFRLVLGIIFAIAFVVTWLYNPKFNMLDIQVLSLAELFGCLACWLPRKKRDVPLTEAKVKAGFSKRTLVAALCVLIAVPLTIFIGMFYFGDKKYYFISLLIILETLIPFFAVFESRKPQVREMLVISVLCALAVAGRCAFYMLPQFKPVLAIVIIAGVCFGGEAGFLVGAVTGFVSNLFFGQGPWTPWQMFCYGLVGFVAGILFKKGYIKQSKIALCIYGFLSTLILFGGIINTSSVIMWQENPTWEMFVTSLVMGVPFDLVHGVSTAFFLWFLTEPMIDKLERVKIKYGLTRKD